MASAISPIGIQPRCPLRIAIFSVQRMVLVLVALSLAVTFAWAQGAEDRLVLTRPWAKLHSQPKDTSRAVTIVYGNDVLTVVEHKDGWLKVRSPAKVVGWLSPQDAADAGSAPAAPVRPAPVDTRNTSAVLPPLPPAASGNPTSADSLRRMGYDQAARRKLTDILLNEKNTPAAYRATREMLTYYPVGDLPPLTGNQIPPELRDTAASLRVSVLLQEAEELVREKKPWDAIFLYQGMLQGDMNSGRAYLALLDVLTQVMQVSAASSNMDNLGLAISIYRKTYPDLALPAGVQA